MEKNKKASIREKKLEKWAIILGIFAAIAAITGYSLRDFHKRQIPEPVVAPEIKHNPVLEKPTEPLTHPKDVSKPKQNAKNSSNITVKDNAKVGIINTGDSASFKDVKQEF